MPDLTQQQARNIVEALTKETGLPVADLLRLAMGDADRRRAGYLSAGQITPIYFNH